MLIVGLTGTVASGKNFVSDLFEKLGAAVFDADKEVHEIFRKNIKVFAQIKKHFPEVIFEDKIDRKKLGTLVFNNQEKLEILEKIVHPIVKKRRENFIKKTRKQGKQIIILNIPLLFEKKIHLNCDKNILVTAPKLIQKQRFLEREKSKISNPDINLLIAKFEDILQNQIPNSKKEKWVDFIIKNGKNESFTLKQVIKIFNKLSKNDGK